MTVVSPIDGVVIERDVVPGNFYDQTNVLLVHRPAEALKSPGCHRPLRPSVSSASSPEGRWRVFRLTVSSEWGG